MAGPFDFFDRGALAMRRITGGAAGEATFNDAGVQQTAATATSTITGHIYSVERTGRESQWRPTQQGPTAQGALRMSSETLCEKGDLIEVDQEGGIVFRYRVTGLVSTGRLMNRHLGLPLRYHHYIEEVPA